MQKRGENKNFLSFLFLQSQKKNKIFEVGPIFKELYNFLPKKLALSSKKYIGLGSEIRDPEKPIPDPGYGVKKAPDPGSGSETLVNWKAKNLELDFFSLCNV